MKTYRSLLLGCIAFLTCLHAFAQQQLSVITSNGNVNVQANNPSSLSAFNLGSAIQVKLLVDLKVVKTVSITDITNHVIATFDSTGIVAANKMITITNSNTVNGKQVQAITLPFNLVVTDSAKKTRTTIIGSAQPNNGNGGNPGGGGGVQPNQYTGIALYDALTIKSLLDGGKTTDLQNFMIHHYSCYKGKNSIKNSENPFFNAVFKNISDNDTATESGLDLSSFSLSSLGGLDVTTIADGLAKFLVKRTKEELNIAFFTRFNKILDDSNTRDLRTLFPQTVAVLHAVGTDGYNYDRYIQNLRAAFKADMDNLLHNIPYIIDNHPAFFAQNPDLAAALRSGVYIAGSLQTQVHPGDILNDYPVAYLDSLHNPNFKGAIQTLQLLSASLRDTSHADTAMYWAPVKTIRSMLSDATSITIYMGIIWQQAKDRNITYDGTTLVDVLNKVAPNFTGNYSAYKTYILGFAEKTRNISSMIKAYSQPVSDSVAVEQYATYFNAAIDMLEYCTQLSELPGFKESKLGNWHVTLEPYFDICYTTSDLGVQLDRKDYPAAINDVVHIYDIYRVIRKESPQKAMLANKYKITINKKAISGDTTNGYYDNALNTVEKSQQYTTAQKASLTTFINNTKTQNAAGLKADSAALVVTDRYLAEQTEVFNQLMYYGSFIASVATAKTSEQVSDAIETFALPSGSARIKRETAFNVSLNAYTGLYMGYENISGLKTDNSVQFNSYGVTAPVGIAISMGRRKFLWMGSEKRTHWSYSAFISLIDVGAVASFRFRDSTTEQIPKVQLKDILSPGLFISVGIPKCPLSVNFGTQMGPNLRKVNMNDNDYENAVYWRYSLSLCVDIPVFNFYTKTNRKDKL